MNTKKWLILWIVLFSVCNLVYFGIPLIHDIVQNKNENAYFSMLPRVITYVETEYDRSQFILIPDILITEEDLQELSRATEKIEIKFDIPECDRRYNKIKLNPEHILDPNYFWRVHFHNNFLISVNNPIPDYKYNMDLVFYVNIFLIISISFQIIKLKQKNAGKNSDGN